MASTRGKPICSERFSCGRVGRDIIVVGGYSSLDTSEIFSLDNMQWSAGPGVPTSTGKFYDSPQILQLEETFIIIGGDDGVGTVGEVYEFDAEFFTWKQRGETLQTRRDLHGVVLISRDEVSKLK